MLPCCPLLLPSFAQEYGIYGGPWQSFVNAPSRTEILSPGTTHVAIGFVDLGGLAAACEVMAAREPLLAQLAQLGANLAAGSSTSGSGSNTRSGSGGGSSSSSKSLTPQELQEQFLQSLSSKTGLKPLRWVGYEQSAYCVAKTLVLLQMVEQGAAVDGVLQVGLSLY